MQEVASFGTLHVDGAGEGVDEAEVDAGEVGVGGGGVYLAVEGVASLQDHLFADGRGDVGVPAVVALGGFCGAGLGEVGVGFDGRGDVGVPAVVTLGGFCGAGLGEVDLDGFNVGPPLI